MMGVRHRLEMRRGERVRRMMPLERSGFTLAGSAVIIGPKKKSSAAISALAAPCELLLSIEENERQVIAAGRLPALDKGLPKDRVAGFILEHDLFRKPVSTFRDHALDHFPVRTRLRRHRPAQPSNA